jgi:hypothetical protein
MRSYLAERFASGHGFSRAEKHGRLRGFNPSGKMMLSLRILNLVPRDMENFDSPEHARGRMQLEGEGTDAILR